MADEDGFDLGEVFWLHIFAENFCASHVFLGGRAAR